MFTAICKRIGVWVVQKGRFYLLLGVLCLLGSVTLTANAILTVSNSGMFGDADVTVDSAGTLNVGTASSTAVVIGKTGTPVTIPGNVAINGALTLGSASTTGQLLFHIASSSFTTLLQASSSQASNLTFTLPTTAGTAGQAMLTDGAGNLFFGNPGSSQWLNGTSGTIFYSSGSIGINTTTPLALLSIVGSATSTAPLFDIASSSGTSLFRVSPNGTVTVGTTVLSPTAGITTPTTNGIAPWGGNPLVNPLAANLPIGSLRLQYDFTALKAGATTVANGYYAASGSNITLSGSPTLGVNGVTFAGGTQWGSATANADLPLDGVHTLFFIGTLSGATSPLTVLSLAKASTNTDYINIWYSISGQVELTSRSSVVEHDSVSALVVPSNVPVALMLAVVPGGNVTLTNLSSGLSISVVNANATGNAQLGIGVDVRLGTFNKVDSLTASYLLDYRRAIYPKEIAQIYQWLSATLAGRGVALAPLAAPQPIPPTLPSNGLTPTPPMGWTAAAFTTSITDAIVRAQTDAMVSTGLFAAGYNYMILDDWWTESRDSQGNLVPDHIRFPNGMKALGDYIHSKGLKFGIYSDPGSLTCANYIGSYGHERQDAQTFASWGVDYVKYDNCTAIDAYYYYQAKWGLPLAMQTAYTLMGQALQATGRPMVYAHEAAIHGMAGGSNAWLWGPASGANTYRTALDLDGCYDCDGANDFVTTLDRQIPFAAYSGPGFFIDADSLHLGQVMNNMNPDESRSEMSMWSMLSSALYTNVNLTTQTADTILVLGNTDVIAVDQDPLGKMAARVSQTACGSKNCEVWAKQMVGNTCAIALLNRDAAPHDITATFSTINGVVSACGTGPYTTTRDLWAHASLGTLTTSYTATAVPAHGVAMIRVAP